MKMIEDEEVDRALDDVLVPAEPGASRGAGRAAEW